MTSAAPIDASLEKTDRFDKDDTPWTLSLMFIGSVLFGLFLLHALGFTEGQGGVPLDDAWIHFQFARNLARGDGLSFNPGEPTSGSTAPLWTVLLAGVYFLGSDFPAAGQWLSGTCYLLTLLATYRLGKQLTHRRWAAWLAAALVAVNGRVIWAAASALETCLFAALSLVAIGAYLKDRARDSSSRYRWSTAVLFGLAALSRPEGYLLFALSLADFTVRVLHTTPASPRALLRRLPLLPAVVFAAIVLPYLAFSLYTGGHLLPNTYHAKAVFDFRPDLDFLSLTARYLILDNPLLLPFYVLGVGVLFRRARLLSLWSVGLPLVYAFLHAVLYQHGRYLIPLIPCNAIIGVAGLLAARRTFAPARALSLRGKGWLAPALLALIVVGTAWRLPTMARLYAWNVDNINRMHVALGRWAREQTPPEALLALNDIGAIAYISERPVLDLAGLVTPGVVPILRGPDPVAGLLELMAGRDVDYVLIFPTWFPGLAARDDLLEPVHRVTLERNTIAGGETMVVYRTHWQEEGE